MSQRDMVKQDTEGFGSGGLVHQDDTFVDATVARAQMEAQKEIESACILARRFPRDETEAYERMMKQCRRQGFAEKALYSYPRGGTQVEGPSINLARTLAQKWGNMRWGIEVVHDSPSSRKIRTWAWDMESNTRVSAEDEFEKAVYRRSGGWRRLDGTGKDDERSLRELTFRKASLILRGCLLQLIPADFVDDAQKECKRSMSGDDKPREERIKDMLVAFNKIGVKKAQLEERLQHNLDSVGEPEIVDLRNIYNSIQDGHSTIGDYFDLPKPAKPSQNETGDGVSEPPESAESDDKFQGAGTSREGSNVQTEPETATEPPAEAHEEPKIGRDHPSVKKLYRLGGSTGLGLTREFIKEALSSRYQVQKFTELTEPQAADMLLLYEVLQVAKDKSISDELLSEMISETFQNESIIECSVSELEELKETIDGG